MTNLATLRPPMVAASTDRARWLALLILCIAPILVVSLTQDIGAHAYDAAVEHIYRGVAFSDVIDDGVLYPRWSQALHWGLGSPLFTFQPPLPYYGMDLLHRLGLPHSLGWRWLMAAGYALAFLGAYLLVREISGRRWPALVAAVAFAYAPYVIRNGFERGSNEAYSMFLYPLVLWSLLSLAKRPAFGRFLLAAGVWAACIASHVLGPLILAPFAGLLAAFLVWSRRTAAPLLALLAGGLLTAFIWAPMAPEQQWVHVERDFAQPEANPARNPIPLEELLAPPVVYDVALDNNKAGERVGLAQTVLMLAGAAIVPFAWRRNRKQAVALAAATVVGLFLFFLFTTWSDWLWRLGESVLTRLLYRTRLMGLQTLAATTAGGLLVAALPRRWQRIGAAALAALFLLVALPSLYVQHQHAYANFDRPPDLSDVRAMEIRYGGTALTAFGEFTPKKRTAAFDAALLRELGTDFNAQTRPLVNPANEVAVRSALVRNQAWNLELSATQPVTATLHLLYYPRWHAFLDGQPIALTAQADTGYVQVAVPAGEHRLAVHYDRTATEWAGLAVSGITVLALLGVGAWRALRTPRQASSGRSSTSQDTSRIVEPAPAVWLLAGLTGLLVLKVAVIDPQTELFRRSSTCEAVQDRVTTVNVQFGQTIRLCAMNVAPQEARPGERMRVTLYWSVAAEVEEPAFSFVHLLGAQFNPATGNPLWGQQDKLVPGELPVGWWQPGKLYKDEYAFAVDGGAPPGSYQLEIGWYAPTLGQRLKPVINIPAPALTVSDLDALLVSGVRIKQRD